LYFEWRKRNWAFTRFTCDKQELCDLNFILCQLLSVTIFQYINTIFPHKAYQVFKELNSTPNNVLFSRCYKSPAPYWKDLCTSQLLVLVSQQCPRFYRIKVTFPGNSTLTSLRVTREQQKGFMFCVYKFSLQSFQNIGE
jgi:hypothetical protein